MREYRLINETFRSTIDLRNYKDVIVDTVKSVEPDAHIEVYQDRYVISDLPRRQIVAIGRLLARTELAQYGSYSVFRLFEGQNIS